MQCKAPRVGVYDNEEINPYKLKFEFSPIAYCGLFAFECAELSLRSFVHYYNEKQLDKYMFSGRELLVKRKRFTISLHVLDKDLINIEALQEVGPISIDDESWWTETYAPKFEQPNFIDGESLVVHFAYSSTRERMIELGLLGKQMDKKLWDALEFN